jgi:hypothetical protein
MVIRSSRDTDEDGIRSLFRASFDKDLSHEEWLWKYRESCFGSASSVAIEDNRIVAHYGGFKLRFYAKGEIYNGYQGCDVMTHPEYRAKRFARKGIIVRTAEAFYRTHPMEFIYGFPPERHARLMTLQLGFEEPRFVSVLRKLRSDFSPLSSRLWKVSSGWQEIRPADIDRLWLKTRDSFGLTIEKNAQYLLWRYRDNPRGRYEIISARRALFGDVRAFAVIMEAENVLYILDLLACTAADRGKMIGSLEHIALSRGHQIICLWANPAEELYHELLENGYAQEAGVRYIVRMFDGSRISSDFFLEKYSYRMGDYDAT